MKETELIETIKSVIGTRYIGDDCAYLEDLGIVVTQDSLVEDVHFSTDWTTPFKLGWKSVMVNISDICAAGAKPLCLTIALSLPDWAGNEFVEEFYQGTKSAADACGAVIAGGDITGSDGGKIFISAAAIGSTAGRRIASRAHARARQKIIVSGEHGSSAAGLQSLRNGRREFIDAHLMPEAQCGFSRQIAERIDEDYAMMDSSDGLMDALSAIAAASGIVMSVEFDKIPYNKEILHPCGVQNYITCHSEGTARPKNLYDLVLYGGEDYQLIATVPESLLKELTCNYAVIGEVRAGPAGVELDGDFFTRKDVEARLYDHFS